MCGRRWKKRSCGLRVRAAVAAVAAAAAAVAEAPRTTRRHRPPAPEACRDHSSTSGSVRHRTRRPRCWQSSRPLTSATKRRCFIPHLYLVIFCFLFLRVPVLAFVFTTYFQVRVVGVVFSGNIFVKFCVRRERNTVSVGLHSRGLSRKATCNPPTCVHRTVIFAGP